MNGISKNKAVFMVVCSAILAVASALFPAMRGACAAQEADGKPRAAYETGSLEGQARLTPYWNDNWPYDRVTFFPLILKSDLKGGYPHQRGEEEGMAGTPLYTFTDEGELDESFMITLKKNRSGSSTWSDKLWEGSLRMFKYSRGAPVQLAPENDDSSSSLKWDFEKKLKAIANGSTPQSRNLFYWFGLGSDISALDRGIQSDKVFFKPEILPYPADNGYYSQSMGLGDGELISEAASYKWHPSRMALGWMIGKNYAVETDKTTVTLKSSPRTMLPDMGQGSMSILDKTPHIPGASPERRERLLFFQTNEGLLHAIDADSAAETMAFVPPNVFHNARMALQKMGGAKIMSEGEGADRINRLAFGNWIDSSGSGKTLPSFLADGAVVVRDVVKHTSTENGNFGSYTLKQSYSADEWETHVVGMNGRGGAGIYSLSLMNRQDRPVPERFKFNWAVENNVYSFVVDQGYPIKGETVYWSPQAGNTGSGKIIKYSDPNSDEGKDKGPFSYWRLGWNAPEPVLGTMLVPGGKASNILVLAGGSQYFVNTSSTGDVGGTVYITDPFTGEILLRRDSTSGYFHRQDVVNSDTPGIFQGRIAPAMGMMITPPSPVTFDGSKVNSSYSGDFLRSVFTADHRGNIFEISFVDEDHSSAKLKLSPRPPAGLFRSESDERDNPRWLATLIDTSSSNTKKNQKNTIPYRFAVAQEDNGFGKDLWIIGGTADVPTVDMTRGGKTSEKLENAKQYIFGFKRRAPLASVQYQGKPIVSITGDGAPLDAKLNRDEMPDYHRTDPFLMEAWYIELETDGTGKPVEFVSAAPFMFGDKQLYAATFLPKEGNSRLYYLNPRTGKGLWARDTWPKYYTLHGAHVRGFSSAMLRNESGVLEPKILVAYTGVLQKTVTHSGETIADLKEDIDGTILTSNIGDAEVFSMTPDFEGEAESDATERIYYWRRYRIE